MHEGHRQRMLERVRSDPKGLKDHELLEIILFGSIPRKNTNPIAHELLAAFGNLQGVLNAEYEQLVTVEGVGEATAAYLKTIGEAFKRAEAEEEPFASIKNPYDLRIFIGKRLRGYNVECIEIYCLNSRSRVYYHKRFSSSLDDQVSVDADEMSRVITAQHPSGLIVAHNHPHGTSMPSAADDRFTAQMQILCSMNNIRFIDHIIIGPRDFYSYFHNGRMEEIKQTYSVNTILDSRRVP